MIEKNDEGGNVSQVDPSAATAPGEEDRDLTAEEVDALIAANPKEGPAVTLEDAERVQAELLATSVSDALDLTARRYRRQMEDPATDRRMLSGMEFLAERASGLADLFRDLSDPSRCAMDGRACALDLLRGFRVLAARHPVPEGREVHAALGNALAMALSERAGVFVDVAPTIPSASAARALLRLWYEQVVRASRAAAQIRAAGAGLSGQGLLLLGKTSTVRAKMITDFQMQGMAELGVLIDCNGLEIGDPLPQDPGVPRGVSAT